MFDNFYQLLYIRDAPDHENSRLTLLISCWPIISYNRPINRHKPITEFAQFKTVRLFIHEFSFTWLCVFFIQALKFQLN